MRRKPAHSRKKIRSYRWWPILLTLAILFVGVLVITQIRKSIFLASEWRTNVVFHTTPTVIVSFPKSDADKNVVVTIPDDAYVDVPFGYGAYRMDSVWRLSELEKRSDLFAETVKDLLGVNMGVAIGESQPKPLVDTDTIELVSTLKKQHPFFELITKPNGSSLILIDRILLVIKLSQLKSNNTTTFASHKDLRLFQESKLPDGTTVKTINDSAIDIFLEQKFEESRAREENLSIEIRNTTNISRVGQKFSRYVTNFGGKVLSITNDTRPTPNCSVYFGKTNQNTSVVKFLVSEFKCDSELDEALNFDVVVFVGDTFADRWNGLELN